MAARTSSRMCTPATGRNSRAASHPHSSMAFFKRLADSVNHQHWGLAKADRDLFAGFVDEYGLALGENMLRSVHSVEFMNSLCVIRNERPTRNLLGRRVVAGSQATVEPDIVRHSKEVLIAPDQSRNPWSARDMSPEEELPLRTVELAERETEFTRLREQVRMAESARNERDAEVNRLAASLQAVSSELKDRQVQLRTSTAQARALESRLEATTSEATDARRRLDTQGGAVAPHTGAASRAPDFTLVAVHHAAPQSRSSRAATLERATRGRSSPIHGRKARAPGGRRSCQSSSTHYYVRPLRCPVLHLT